jgi:hypothetical protein
LSVANDEGVELGIYHVEREAAASAQPAPSAGSPHPNSKPIPPATAQLGSRESVAPIWDHEVGGTETKSGADLAVLYWLKMIDIATQGL